MVIDLIEELDINIAVSFYMNGLLSNFRVKDGKPIFSTGHNPRPMGMFFNDEDGWIASHSALTYYRKFEHEEANLFRPIVSHYIGYVDSHETVAVGKIPIVNATLFNKLVTINNDIESDFKIIYNPSYCNPEIQAKDTHHVNGIGLRNGKIRYVSSFSDKAIDQPKGWKEFEGTGVVWDVIEDKAVIEDLYLPHSPRWHEGSLYVCNSGTGELIKYSNGTQEKIRLGNFIRGMEFFDNYIFIGASKTRNASRHIDQDLVKKNDCGLFVIAKNEFEPLGFIDFNEHFPKEPEVELKEIFDLAIMPSNTLIATATSDGYKFSHFF